MEIDVSKVRSEITKLQREQQEVGQEMDNATGDYLRSLQDIHLTYSGQVNALRKVTDGVFSPEVGEALLDSETPVKRLKTPARAKVKPGKRR